MLHYLHLDTFGTWLARIAREWWCFFSWPRIGHVYPTARSWDLDPDEADSPVPTGPDPAFTCTRCGYFGLNL